MWGSKWLLASLFTEENIIADAVERLMFRSGHFSEKKSMGVALRNSWQYIDGGRLFTILLLLFILIVCVRIKRGCPIKKETLPSLGVMLLVSLYPFGWYFIALEHSTGHGHFTWREFGISVFGILAMGVADLRKMPERIPERIIERKDTQQ